ncbi:PREDICTED: uncharacterized protein LOC106852691 [Sturnus vulgaris]|uniref:uncharacterized protein LOC106852691 n=1 Tax=Sturnus vulgaris TaxID=9172 RepID=UPI00071A2210|nr:PREDICTED: uncharacterized protein LOC106852691 [Sturnus vulgaris]
MTPLDYETSTVFCGTPVTSRAAVTAIPAAPSYGGVPELPREPAGKQGPRSELAAVTGGGYLIQEDYVSQRLLPGLHMLDAAPGASRQLPVRRPVRCGGGRCGSRRCGSRGHRRRGHRGGSRRFPVQLPPRFLVRLPVPPPAGHPPGILPGSSLASARPSPAAGPGPSHRCPAGPGSMPRGRAWTQAEVSSLLSLVGGSGEAALLMASTSRPNEALWREISRGLAEAGYGRSVAQCRSKWKALKQAFHSERETRRRAGHHSPRLPPHYRAMKSIWKAAGRPVFGERRMPDVVNLPSRKRRSALAIRSPSSPEPPEHDIGGDTPTTLLSPVLQRAKDEPESHAGGCFSPVSLLGCHTDLKQEGAEGKTGFPGETSPGMGRGNQMVPLAAAATGSHGTAAMSEQPAAGEDASDTSLHGSGVAGLLQNVQQLLVQILQTSRQQQALLESLASDTVSHLHLLSHSLVQVGETLHQLLLRPQTHPGPVGHYIPLYEGASRMPCSPGAPHTSPDHKEEPQLSPDARCIPP